MRLWGRRREPSLQEQVEQLRKDNYAMRSTLVQPWVHKQVEESRDVYQAQVTALRAEVAKLRDAVGVALRKLRAIEHLSAPVRSIVARLERDASDAGKRPPPAPHVLPSTQHRGRRGGYVDD